MNRAYLQALDELRYSDPEEARRLAEVAVEQSPAALLPLSLGILGSAFRSLGRLAEAEEAIVTGIELARRSEDWWTTGNLVARHGYVVGDQGDMHGAAELAAEACSLTLETVRRAAQAVAAAHGARNRVKCRRGPGAGWEPETGRRRASPPSGNR